MKRLLSVLLISAIPVIATAQMEAAYDYPFGQGAFDLLGRVPEPKPKIYDEAADAKSDIKAAVARAGKENRRVLIQWGANWCSWCHLLHGTLKSDRKIVRELSYEYDVVLVDIGQWNKNMELALGLGADLKAHGVPYLTVLDGAGKPIANQETDPLESADKSKPAHDPAKVLEFLKKNQAEYLSAEDVLSKALAAAKAADKRVFLHFGAPWCGWCHRLEDWMAKPEVSAIMGKDFIDVKIDTDRTIGGQALLDKTRGTTKGGIPWFVVLDPAGAAIVTSDAPNKGNIGFPGEPPEIAHFISMMEKSARNMTAPDIAALKASLEQKPKAPAGAPDTMPMETIKPPPPPD